MSLKTFCNKLFVKIVGKSPVAQWCLVALLDRWKLRVEKEQAPGCKARADHVRKVARIFGWPAFPEILPEAADCEMCEQWTLLVVHPFMICDGCWLAQIKILQTYTREEMQRGTPRQEAYLIAIDRFRRDLDATVEELEKEEREEAALGSAYTQ